MTTGSVLAQFTIHLSVAVAEPVEVSWRTADGTAKAGVDYAAASGVAIFAPGQTTKTVDVLVYGRAVGSEDRSFFVEMQPPVNAILGAATGECIIHVDTTGSTPVTQVIVPTGPRGIQGKSAYQVWLDLGNTGTEQDFIDSLSPSAQEIAQEVAPLLDVGNSPVTALGTNALPHPDSTTVATLARRVAYVGTAKLAIAQLAAGDNLLSHSDLNGDSVDFNSVNLYPRILRGQLVIPAEWSVDAGDKILIKSAEAGDYLYLCQYDAISYIAVKNTMRYAERQIFESLRRSYAKVGLNLAGSFQRGFNISATTDIGLDENTGRCYSGPIGYVPADTNPTGVGFVDVSNKLSSTFDTLADIISYQHLVPGQRCRWLGRYEVSDGGGNWGFVKEGPHVEDGGSVISITPTMYIEANLKGSRVSVKKFGARSVSNGQVYDCIAQIRACERYVRAAPDPNLQQTILFPCGKYGISDTWHVDDALELNIKFDNAHLTSMATVAKGAMLLATDWVLCNIHGKVRFDNTNSEVTAKFLTGFSLQPSVKGTNKNSFYNITSMFFEKGLIIGDAANDMQCSENTFFNYNQFECTQAIDGGGSQTGANFIGGNIHGTPHSNLTGKPIHAAWLKGGFWSFNGSSILTTQSASNQCLRLNPDKGSKPSYPQVRINGGVLETASPLALIDNPDNVALDRSVQPGQLCITGIGGYCGDTPVVNANFIEASDDFYGKIQVKNNNFYSIAPRNAFNIKAGPVAEVDTDSSSWGLNFRDFIGGCSGGILKHANLLVAVAYNSAGATYAQGVKQSIKFATKSPLPRYQRYNEFFNLNTGIYTVPQGGHQSMTVECNILAYGLSGDIFVEVDGVAIAFGQLVGVCGKVTATIESLSGGQTVGVYLQPAAGPVVLTQGKFNNISFTVSN